ncbi:AraC family transcriptional regulator ligand-binding domain-containing protein [Pseudohaliea sp.]|uniref:AraC family transcriptional regulator n=1 Tax=Pseudohaliea sp. TaxID=2740289 RepID=UPI0032EACE69
MAIPLLRIGELREVLGTISAAAAEGADLAQDQLADPRGFLGVDAVWRLFSAQIAVTGDELLGLGKRAHPAGLTEIIVARALHAATLGEAMQVFCATANLLQDELRVTLRSRHGELLLSAMFPKQLDRRHQLYLEIACLPWHCTFRWLSGSQLPLRRFVTHPSRRGAGTQLMAMMGCPIRYHGNGVTLVYPEVVADLPSRQPPLAAWRRGIYEVLLEQLRERPSQFHDDELVDYVQRALRQGVQSQAAIASSIGMSVATLRRQLARRDTDFRRLRDRVIAEDAVQLLHAGYTTEGIAEKLGFSDARSFRRAFQRVLGLSPGQFRARLTQQD